MNAGGRWPTYRWTIGLACLWTIAVLASARESARTENAQAIELARLEARAGFYKDLTFRKWASSHGGVYVPVDEGTQPNPHLSQLPERDIVTPSGRRLTLMNPAYMTRQVHELEAVEDGVRGHITSLNPIRPENAADAWETKALKAFEQGVPEVSSAEEIDGKPYMRLMRPMVVESTCLKCHGNQGYREGDIRGGISISVPMQPYLTTAATEMRGHFVQHGLVWLFGILVLTFVSEVLVRTGRRVEQAAELEQERDALVRGVFESTSDFLIVKDADLRYRMVNPAFCQLIGRSQDDVVGKSAAELFDRKVAESLTAADRAVLESATPASTIESFTGAQGLRWLQVSRVPLVDEAGRVTGLLNSIRDVSDLKSIESALRDSESKSRALLAAIPDLMFRISREGVHLDFHAHDLDALYLKPQEFMGKNVRDTLPADVAAEYLRHAEAVITTGEMRSFDYDLAFAPNDVRTFEARMVKGGDDDVLAIVRDVSERRRVERALRESESRYRTLADAGRVLIWTSGLDKKCDYFNQTWLRFTGRPLEQELGDGWTEGVHPDDLARCVETYVSSFDQRQPFSMEYRLRNAAGEYRWILDDGTPRYDSNGEFLGYIGHCLDVTERRAAEQALRESEERFRITAQMASDIIYRRDYDTGIAVFYGDIDSIQGYPPGGYPRDLPGFFEHLHPDDASGHYIQAFAEHADSPAILQTNFRLRRADGSWVHWEERGRHLFDENGVPIAWLGAATNVTEQRRTLEVLRASEEKFRLLAENISDAIWMIDLNERFTYLSPSAQKLWGYTTEEGLRIRLRDSMTPESYETAVRTIAEELARDDEPGIDPNRTRLMELEQIHKNGTRFWSEVTAKFLRNADGTICGIIGATRDVTERRRADLILRTRLELSERIAEADVDTLLQQTLDCAEQLTGSNIGFFHFVDPDQTSLRLQTWSTHTLEKMCTAEGKGQHYPIGMAGVWADCFYSREPVIHNDYASLPNKKGMPDGHAPVIRELVVPMVQHNLVFAILGVGNKPTDYTEEDVRNVQSLASLAMEVVARKRAEDALREKSGELDQYFTRALDLFCIADTDGYFRRLNRQWENTLGYPLAVLEGSRFLDLIHPEDLDGTLRAVARLSEQEDVIDFVNRYRCADGSYRWIEWRAYPQGKNIFAAARDITPRMESERALRESEAQLKQAQEAARLGHYVLDARSGTWTCSDALDRLFGIDAGAPKTIESWLGIVHPDDREMMAAYFRDEVIGRRQRFDKLYRILRADDGTTHWVHGLGDLEFGPDGAPVSMFGVIQDVTKDVEAEKREEQLRDQLQQAMKLEAVGRLAGGVAHDFNNLLTVINGNTDLLISDMGESSPYRDDLAEIKKAAERAASLTAQLLAFSRKQMIAPRVVDINELVAGSTRMLKRLIGEDIELSFIPGSDVGMIRVDPHQIEQVLINLAVNARDAMPKGGRLRVETGFAEIDEDTARGHVDAAPGAYVRVVVADSGVGIPPDLLPHLFEPFFTTKEVGKGTGLGLSMVYGIIRQNNGFIEVESEPGIGTTFRVYLPRIESDSEKEKSPASSIHPGGSERILLVEDESPVRALTRRFLERLGYTVVEFGRGRDAVDWARGSDVGIDLLLTDVIMPEMNGRQLHDALSEIRPNLPVLFMSGYTGDTIAQHGVLEERTDFLQKPFTLDELARALRAAFGRT